MAIVVERTTPEVDSSAATGVAFFTGEPTVGNHVVVLAEGYWAANASSTALAVTDDATGGTNTYTVGDADNGESNFAGIGYTKLARTKSGLGVTFGFGGGVVGGAAMEVSGLDDSPLDLQASVVNDATSPWTLALNAPAQQGELLCAAFSFAASGLATHAITTDAWSGGTPTEIFNLDGGSIASEYGAGAYLITNDLSARTVSFSANNSGGGTSVVVAASFKAAVTTIGPVSIAGAGDDVEFNQNGFYLVDGEGAVPGNAIYWGKWDGGTSRVGGAFRFALPAAIPAGAVVADARLTGFVRDSQYWPTTGAYAEVHAEDDNDVPAHSASADYPWGGASPRPLTTAVVRWPATGDLARPTNGTLQTTPNLAPLIQELVDTYGGLASGARVAIWLSSPGTGQAEMAWDDFLTSAADVATLELKVVAEAASQSQFARPASDNTDGAWSPSTGADLYACIDEAIGDDGDYIAATSNTTGKVNLGSLTTPDAGTQTLRIRAAGSPAKKLIARLLEGATARATITVDPLTGTVTQYTATAAGITDYSNLDLEFEVGDATTPPSLLPTWGAVGTGASGTTSCTPAYPTGINAATSKLICVVTGRSNTANTAFTMPAGWTSLGQFEGGTGTWGVDTGTRRVGIFIKDTTLGTETGTVTVSLAGTTANTLRATIHRIEVPAGYSLQTEFASGADTTNGTGFSAAASSNIALDPSTLLLIAVAQCIDSGTQSAQSITASGITFGTRTNRASTAVTNGNDHRHIIDTVPVSSGSGTVAPTYAYTISANGSGPVAFLALKAVAPTEFARVTWAEFEVPATSGPASQTATLGGADDRGAPGGLALSPGAVTVAPGGAAERDAPGGIAVSSVTALALGGVVERESAGGITLDATRRAMRFDSAGDRASAPIPGFATSALTLFGRARRNSDSGAYACLALLLGPGGSGSYHYIGTDADGDSLRSFASGGADTPTVATLANGEWFDWAYTNNGATQRLYFKLAGAGAWTEVSAGGVAALSSISNFSIGNNDLFTQPWPGDIADVRVWSVVLTGAELLAEAASEVAVVTSGLWADWRTESIAGLLLDSSGNARHLTASGTVVAVEGPEVSGPTSAQVDLGGVVERESAGGLSTAPGAVQVAIGGAAERESAGGIAASVGLATISPGGSIEREQAGGLAAAAGAATVSVGGVVERERAGGAAVAPGPVTVAAGGAAERERAGGVSAAPGAAPVSIGGATETQAPGGLSVAPGPASVAAGGSVEREAAGGLSAAIGLATVSLGGGLERERAGGLSATGGAVSVGLGGHVERELPGGLVAGAGIIVAQIGGTAAQERAGGLIATPGVATIGAGGAREREASGGLVVGSTVTVGLGGYAEREGIGGIVVGAGAAPVAIGGGAEREAAGGLIANRLGADILSLGGAEEAQAAGGARVLVSSDNPGRRYVIPAAARTYAVPAAVRTQSIPAESRVYLVPESLRG